jgi:hypothetical protein
MSKPYTLTLTLSLKGEGINGWALTIVHWQFEMPRIIYPIVAKVGGLQSQGGKGEELLWHVFYATIGYTVVSIAPIIDMHQKNLHTRTGGTIELNPPLFFATCPLQGCAAPY